MTVSRRTFAAARAPRSNDQSPSSSACHRADSRRARQRAPSIPFDATRRAPRRCRRESIRRTGCGPARPDRAGEYVAIVEVTPFRVATRLAIRRRRRLGRVAVEPVLDVVVVELLAEDHACEGLAHHGELVVAGFRGPQRRVVCVGLALAIGERLLEVGAEVECRFRAGLRKTDANLRGLARRNGHAVPAR